MKVVGYAGSRSAFSKSICLGEKLKTMLREKNIEMELYTARNNVVEECRGCGKCFDEGLCPQDQEDSMEYIRKKILEADLIVLLSPVYLNNVSGAMKTFLDRIGSWVHTLALSGKMGIVVTVTDQSGQEFVSYYLQKLLLQMGCNVVGEYKVVALEELDQEEVIERIVSNIVKAFSDQEQYISTADLENTFQYLKARFVNADMEQYKDESYEIKYWYDSGWQSARLSGVLNLRNYNAGVMYMKSEVKEEIQTYIRYINENDLRDKCEEYIQMFFFYRK